MNPCLCQLARPGRPKLTIAAHFSSQHLLRLLQRSIRLHRRSKPKRRLRKSRSSPVDELAAVIASGPSSISSHGIWRECWQPAGSIRHIGPHEGVKLCDARLQHALFYGSLAVSFRAACPGVRQARGGRAANRLFTPQVPHGPRVGKFLSGKLRRT